MFVVVLTAQANAEELTVQPNAESLTEESFNVEDYRNMEPITFEVPEMSVSLANY